MPTQKKIDTVADLKERIERATLVASTEYRGLRVKEMVEMRRRLREAGIDVKVIKNTLLKLAAEGAGQPDLLDIVEGPTALALTYGDAIEAAKALSGYAQGAPQGFAIRGGYMDGSVLSAKDVRDLVRIPPRPVLLAQFMGQMQSPLAGFVGLMEAPLRELTGLMHSLLSEFPGLVEARARQMEALGIGTEEPAAEEPAAEEPAAAEPAAEEPAAEEPAAEEPAAEEPTAEEPVAEEPAAEELAEGEPTTEEPTTEEPTTEEPTTEEPAAEEPAAEEPAAEEPAAEEPATEDPAGTESGVEQTEADEPDTAKEENNG
jgi:ribosomal protein L10